MLATGALRASDTLGRFELRKVLGQGAQSTVWLAFDPRLEREVAIKVMRPDSGSDAQAVAHWLDEARSVGRVKHPNIVPVYEADIQDQQPYLVFEYIAGQTLADILRQRGAMNPHEAVALMMDVLDAVAVAHASGVVHRDLKPSNVLVDSAGRARVTDFGIAARIEDRNSKDPLAPGGGTVGYLSPEAANGAAPAPSMDIFSAGVVLAEMLMGKPLIDERDPYRAVYRVVHEQLVLPADTNPDVDDRLRAIVARALARDPNQRFPSARAFLGELEQWAKPEATLAPAEAGGQSSTLDFLLRRMRHKSDFPALSDSVVRIQSMATSETESVNSVTNEILKDVALTNKLLRMVNSAHYAHRGSINTVSRAVNLVGFNGIRNMALSLVLLEHMQDKAHANQLKEEFLRCLMAASIGGELCPLAAEGEEAFIGSMFQNLGRLLVQFYFPEEASQIRILMQTQREPPTETQASITVLGLSFEDLGLGIAKAWGLPQSMQRCMRKPVGAVPSRAPMDSGERIRWIAMASNEIADVLLHSDPKDVDARVQAVTRKYAPAMGVGSKSVQTATVAARQKLVELAQAMEIWVKPGSAAAKLLQIPDIVVDAVTSERDTGGANGLAAFELHATNTVAPDAAGNLPSKDLRVTETLTAGIQDITNAMVEDFKLSDVLRMILETMFRAMHFDHIIFCMRDAKTETMTGRFGLGDGVEAHVKGFKSPLKAATPDLFAVVCNKGTDTMISDAAEPRLAQRLPNWYRTGLNAPTFLLLPLMIKGAPFGLIYADKKTRGALELDEKELALLRTLRNQAVMAFKQSS
ncbi:MAG: HDOD domain-containing protein [Burkholderiales bacterium]|nr:HDOD domain-containing protein [Burkholderiales bacterium]